MANLLYGLAVHLHNVCGGLKKRKLLKTCFRVQVFENDTIIISM